MTRPFLLRAILMLALLSLAALQYEWAGELSEAERERRIRSIDSGADRFAAELEFEIGRLFRFIQSPQDSEEVLGWSIPQGLENWRAEALEPTLVTGVYWSREQGEILRLAADDSWVKLEEVPMWLDEATRRRSHQERRPRDRRRGPIPMLPMGRGIGVPMMTELLDRRVTLVICEFSPEALTSMLEAIAVRSFGSGRSVHWVVSDEFSTIASARAEQSSNFSVDRPLLTFERGPRPRRSRSEGPGPPGGWRLVAGPVELDTGIGAFRAKMLAISAGVLAVLIGALALLGRSAHESSVLAQRQLDFVSSVSHELRTPLAAIRSAAENLSAGIIKEPEAIKRYGEMLDKESRRLDGLVTRVLSTAGLLQEAPELARRQVDLRELVHSSVERSRGALRDAELELAGLAGEAVLAVVDPEAIARTIDNLLLNAASYSRGRPWIRVALDSDDGEVRIEIEDRGRGMNAAERRQAFDPFWRSQAVVAEGLTGTGLGLALVARSIEAHGGRVELESTPGEGSTFRLILPRGNP